MNILFIEDDSLLSKNVSKAISSKNKDYNFVTVTSPIDSINEIEQIEIYDLVLVDLQLTTGESLQNLWGFKIISTIREKDSKIPIIVLSGKTEIECLRTAFELWANDYLIKPLRLKELEVRVINWLRERKKLKQKPIKINPYNGLKYDKNVNEFYYEWIRIPLTRMDKKLLLALFLDPKKVVTESEIIGRIWRDNDKTTNRNIRVSLMRLKKSLAPFWLDDWIKNIRGEGYMLN
jgi:DNA-binding response OmpR family regulator